MRSWAAAAEGTMGSRSELWPSAVEALACSLEAHQAPPSALVRRFRLRRREVVSPLLRGSPAARPRSRRRRAGQRASAVGGRCRLRRPAAAAAVYDRLAPGVARPRAGIEHDDHIATRPASARCATAVVGGCRGPGRYRALWSCRRRSQRCRCLKALAAAQQLRDHHGIEREYRWQRGYAADR